jgi:uncharacterized membrane protein YqjE
MHSELPPDRGIGVVGEHHGVVEVVVPLVQARVERALIRLWEALVSVLNYFILGRISILTSTLNLYTVRLTCLPEDVQPRELPSL